MKKIIYIFCFCSFFNSFTQQSFNDYANFHPLGDDPNVRLLSSLVKQETILFEANPILKLSFYNNFMKGLMNEDKHTKAWYLSFKPQIRMYTDESLPVKTPSYRIFFGTQHLYALTAKDDMSAKFLGYMVESGHYSNGQSGCAFSDEFKDGTSECNDVYKTITSSTDLSKILNRRSGNFSTNLTKIIVSLKNYKLNDDLLPKESQSINVGYTLYHDRFLGVGDFGGFTDNDIKIYGRYRFLGEYEFMRTFKKNSQKRYILKQKIEYISNPHNSVNPLRMETVFKIYPFAKSKSIGIIASYIYGHDNYNFRFVDSGHQVALGITWDKFPPFTLKGL